VKNSRTDEWNLRVGSAAVASLRKANRFLGGLTAALALVALGILASKPLGPPGLILLWICVFLGFTYMIFGYPIGYIYYSLRGGREAALYIGLSHYSKRTRVPVAALKSPRAFDNFMVEEGIPPGPSYTPDPDPLAHALAEKMRQKRERALQKRQAR
jgi:hypothetical protein